MRKLLIFTIFISVSVFGQTNYFKRANNLHFLNGNDTISNALSGGFNSVQVSKIDLDNDGIEDIFLFDRTSEKPSTFLVKNIGGTIKYIYSPDYESYFKDLKGWVLLRDYNCDGKKDIFANTSLGIRVFKNITQPGGNLQFVLVKEPVYTQGSFSQVNLQLAITDIPSITDIDDDGDLDIFVFDFFSGSYVEFHKNLSIETYGTCDSLKYQRISSCWGSFSENATCGDFSFGVSCKTADVSSVLDSTERIMHVGSSILVTDLDGDNIKDILLGDVSCTDLVKLINVGTNATAEFTSFQPNYPTQNPVNIHVFPAAFSEDIDNDGKKDLVVSPNMTNNSARDMDFYNSLWYYKNTSTTSTPNYSFVQNDFLQSQTIDIGERSHPLFWDIDADGDEDLLLTSWGLLEGSQFKSKVFLYENLGNNSFKLIDDDYLDFAQYNFYSLKLTKGDLNGDGALDLLYARTESGGVSSRIMAVYNQNAANNPISFTLANSFSVGINSITSDAPFLYDLDIDGDNDLLVGALSGKLFYYENIGSNTNYNFNLVTDTLGGIKNNSLRSMTVPFVANLDGNNKPELVIGNNTGVVRVYPDFTNNLNGVFTNFYELVAKNSINNTLFQPKLGKYISPCMYDYNADSQPDLFCGTYGGGIIVFENITSVINKANSTILKPDFRVFPNPASDKLYVETSEIGIISIKTIDGKLISATKASENSSIDISHINNGIYFVEFKNDKFNYFQKVIISK